MSTKLGLLVSEKLGSNPSLLASLNVSPFLLENTCHIKTLRSKKNMTGNIGGKIRKTIALVFAILMENGQGVISKSPEYVAEKLAGCEGLENPEGLLDSSNLVKLRDWENRWSVEENKPKEGG